MRITKVLRQVNVVGAVHSCSAIYILVFCFCSYPLGLVPATNPWYGIISAHQRDYRKRNISSHADNADFTDASLCAVSEICVS